MGQTPFTPSVQLIFALDIALQEFVEEGYKKRIERYQELAKRMRDGIKKLGFELILLPEGMQLEALIRQTKTDRNDFYSLLLITGKDLVGSVTIEEAE